MGLNRFILFFLFYFTNSMNAHSLPSNSFSAHIYSFAPENWSQFVLDYPAKNRTFKECSKKWSFDSCDRLFCLATTKLNKSTAFLKILNHDLTTCQNKESLHNGKKIMSKWFLSRSRSDWDNDEMPLDFQNFTQESELQKVRQALGRKSMSEITSKECLELSFSSCIVAYCLTNAKLNGSKKYPQMLRSFVVTCYQDKVLAPRLLDKVKLWEETQDQSMWDDEGPSHLAIEKMIQSNFESQSDMKVCVPGFVDDRDRGIKSLLDYSKSSFGKELLEGNYHNIPLLQPSPLLLDLIRNTSNNLRTYHDCIEAQFNSQKDLSLCLIATKMNKSYAYFTLLKKLRYNCVNPESQICRGLSYKRASWQLGNKSPYGWDQYGEPEHISEREKSAFQPSLTFMERLKEQLYIRWILLIN